MRRLLLAVLLALLGGARAARAQGPPEPGAELAVSLVTMGVGDAIWERFGHNAILVTDRARGVAVTYNYGLFDFRQERFFLKFLQGRMWYAMGGRDAARDLATYQGAGRSIWEQELDLAPAQRLELLRFLEWNALPEHRGYRYDYYRDNCSTRVRDALDRVLGGAIRRVLDTIPTGTSYRWHTERLTAADVPMYTLLLVGMGHPVERPLDAWEEAFIPMELQRHLRGVRIETAAGSRPLVRAERQLFAGEPTPERPPQRLPAYLAVGLAIGALIAGLGWTGRDRAFGLAGAAWAFVAGLAGLVLALMWAFTDHVALHGNENVLQLPAVALALVALLPRARRSPAAARAALVVAGFVVAMAVAGVLLKVLPGFYQRNGDVVALALPAHLGVAVGAWRVGLRSRRPA